MKRFAVLAAALLTAVALPAAAQDAAATAVVVDQSGATIGTLTLMEWMAAFT